jgi:hypothetical protein
MARLEYKYYIPLQYLDNLRRDIMPFLVYDVFTKNRPKKEYTIHSLYLDSHQLKTYYEKLDGARVRNKFRIRGYNQLEDNSSVFLEIKRKEIDFMNKDRALLRYSNLETFLKTSDMSLIITSDSDVLKRKTSARNFLYYYNLHILQPAVFINYEREAFECKFGSGLRVTLDKNIRSKKADGYKHLFSDSGFKPALTNQFVLEVKFHKILPNWLPAIMKRYNIIRESVPKYAMSIESSRNQKLLTMK